MTKYQKQKEAARAAAVEHQRTASQTAQTWQEVATSAAKFEKLARRFGLVREFQENGII